MLDEMMSFEACPRNLKRFTAVPLRYNLGDKLVA